MTQSQTAASLADERRQLDATVWSLEIEAQRHERFFVQLWDNLRHSENGLRTLAETPLNSIELGQPGPPELLDLGINRIRFGPPTLRLNHADWAALVRKLHANGFRLVESEWHHSAFAVDDGASNSSVDFSLHVSRGRVGVQAASSGRFIVRGRLNVRWSANEDGQPQPTEVVVQDLTVLGRGGSPIFQKAFTYERRDQDVASAHPIIIYDLDQNGFPEIIISRWNRVYWNEGAGRFREGLLLSEPTPLSEAGVVADVTADGQADFVSVAKNGDLVVFAGDADGRFTDQPKRAADVRITNPSAISAADADNDGDVDLWVTQYAPSYLEGQMPTPYYDANDGYEAYYLENQGDGAFVDRTVEVGLAAKRRRRTYSSSFVDFDQDKDMDLVVVSDYAGVDFYENDGHGRFSDVSESLVDQRHLFGMAHTFGDYNLDGLLDLYAIGMSSTTARRLDDMNLGRSDRADVHRMRSAMAYGNRMFVYDGKQFVTPKFAPQVARTGWSWGTTSFDFDIDGDQDVYVANGFRTGQSCSDYCSTYWRHDLYTGDSTPNRAIADLFRQSMLDLNTGRISWNGYEHNALHLNLDGRGFVNVAYLLGVGFEYDSRAVVGADLDGDGLPDLLVTEHEFAGAGFLTKLHVYRNTLESAKHWIGVRLGQPQRGGVAGAKVTLTAGDARQIRQYVTGDSFSSQHPAVAHFGLGERTTVDRIEVQWPDGSTIVYDKPAIDQYHTADPTDGATEDAGG